MTTSPFTVWEATSDGTDGGVAAKLGIPIPTVTTNSRKKTRAIFTLWQFISDLPALNVLDAKPPDSSCRIAKTGRYLARMIVRHYDLSPVQGAVPDTRRVTTQEEQTNIQMDMEVQAIKRVSFESVVSETSCPEFGKRIALTDRSGLGFL